MNLGAFRDKFVRELSTGSRRIVDLAMCIAHDPSVLLLDEPSSGHRPGARPRRSARCSQRIQAETGCALLVIEHDMPLITAISDRMIALELGHPIVEGTPAGGHRATRGSSSPTSAATRRPSTAPAALPHREATAAEAPLKATPVKKTAANGKTGRERRRRQKAGRAEDAARARGKGS